MLPKSSPAAAGTESTGAQRMDDRPGAPSPETLEQEEKPRASFKVAAPFATSVRTIMERKIDEYEVWLKGAIAAAAQTGTAWELLESLTTGALLLSTKAAEPPSDPRRSIGAAVPVKDYIAEPARYESDGRVSEFRARIEEAMEKYGR